MHIFWNKYMTPLLRNINHLEKATKEQIWNQINFSKSSPCIWSICLKMTLTSCIKNHINQKATVLICWHFDFVLKDIEYPLTEVPLNQ